MNSLIRLVGEDLQSTPATDLAHKKAIILDTTGSNRELKEMDLSEPTFGDVSCTSLSATTVKGDQVSTSQLVASSGSLQIGTEAGNVVTFPGRLAILGSYKITGYLLIQKQNFSPTTDQDFIINGENQDTTHIIRFICKGDFKFGKWKWSANDTIQWYWSSSNPYGIAFAVESFTCQLDDSNAQQEFKVQQWNYGVSQHLTLTLPYSANNILLARCYQLW